jgi:putative hydrolase of the HAD superfamily
MKLKVIAFDTLWINETYFDETEQKFCGLMEDYLSHQGISKELFKVEIDNLKLYGYGIKGYILSMIEAAMTISTIPFRLKSSKIIQYGKNYSKTNCFTGWCRRNFRSFTRNTN